MILAIDVGNTETVLGLFHEPGAPEGPPEENTPGGTGSGGAGGPGPERRDLEPVHAWRVATDARRTADEHAFVLQGFLDRSLSPSDGPLRRGIMASVVPVMDRVWKRACHTLGVELEVVSARTPLPIRLDVDDPAGVGADRIVNTLAASVLYRRNTVVVDLGTATTYDCISDEGVFLGGVIAPGPRAGLERLTAAASRLPQVELAPPEKVIGRRTEACLNSGIFYSVVDGIDGIVRRILEEWAPADPLVVATGGLVGMLAPHCRTVERIEPHLTLVGLALVDRHLSDGAGER